MPAIVAIILGALGALIVRLIPVILTRALLFLGIGFATVTGVDIAFSSFISSLEGYFHNLPATVMSLLTIAGVPTALSFLLSAIAFKLTLKLVAGSMTFYKTHKPLTIIK